MGTYTSVVQSLYATYFNRPADYGGLNYWEDQITRSNAISGDLTATIKTVANAFSASSEYTSLFTGKSSIEIVNTIYQNLFNRTGDLTTEIGYWALRLDNGTFNIGNIAYSIQVGAQNADATCVENKIAAATAFTNALDTYAEAVAYSGAAANAVAKTWLGAVTDDAATLTAATGSVDATVASAVAAQAAATVTTRDFALTSSADNIPGTTGNDTITGNVGTLTSSDEIHGLAGTDTLSVKIDNLTANSTGYAPIIDGVETITLEARNASATFFMTNVSGATTLNVKGITNFGLADLANSGTVNVTEGYSADLTLDLATNTATAQSFTVNFNSASGTDIRFVDDSGTTAADTLTLNAITNWGNGSSATNFSGVEKLVLKGQGDINLNMASGVAGGMSADAFVDTTAIDASGMTGALTLRLDSVDINLKGGSGNDVFIMTANLNTNDTVDGGAGTDQLDFIATGGYIRPIISNVETLNIAGNATAATADFRDVSGVNTVNLMLATGMVIDKATTSISTFNLNSSDASGNALTIQYGTAAIASNVTLNLSNDIEGTLQSAMATASGMSIGTITMSGNSGSLSIVTNSTASWTADAIELNEFTAVTLNAASAKFAVSGVADVNSAQTLTLTMAAGKTMTIGDDLCADLATNVTINVGASGTFGLTAATASFNASGATVTLNAADGATINGSGMVLQLCGATQLDLSVGLSGVITAQTILLGEAGGSAGTGAVAMNTINISAAGDVNIGSMVVASAADTAINLTLNAVLVGTGTAADINISGFTINDNAKATTASEQSVTINISGTGQFSFSAAATDSSNVTYRVNATALGSGSMVTIDLSNVNDTGSVASAVFGAASGLYIGLDGVDNVEAGLGVVTIDGGLGNDLITLGNTAATKVRFSAAASGNIAGFDTIAGAGAGDVIIFAGGGTATAAYSGGNAPSTGSATTANDFRTTSFSAQVTADSTALDQLAIYTAAGDTIIELLTQATATGATIVSAVDYVRIVLTNKDFTAITAAFQLNITGTGLSITLL